MEIIVKAKQANNPMFLFLHFDCELHNFYRHVLTAIRNGTYVPVEDEEAVPNEKEKAGETNEPEDGDSDDSEKDNSYLHPSLQSKAVPVRK